MVFKKKKIEETVEEVPEVESPTAEEIISEDEPVEAEEPIKAEDPDNQLNVILNDLNNRIQNLEAFNFRLKNI